MPRIKHDQSAQMKRVLHVLTGPTAVGKTEWALRWAKEQGAEIVSCDSLLFYRGMDIGTAKPTAVEQARVPHHLIDMCAVTERSDVTHYVAKARAAVDAITGRGRAVLVTGGSGFYLKSFLRRWRMTLWCRVNCERRWPHCPGRRCWRG